MLYRALCVLRESRKMLFKSIYHRVLWNISFSYDCMCLVHLKSSSEWLNSAVALSWLDSNAGTHCTCNASSKYLMFYNVVWTAPSTHTFWCSTQTHIHLVLAGSVTVPHLQSWPGRGIRPFPLMKLSEELTAKHRALLICSTLLVSIVLFKTFSSHCFSFTRPLCPFFLSSLFSSPSLLFYPLPSSCSSPSHLPSNYFSVCLPLHVVLTFSCLPNRQLMV